MTRIESDKIIVNRPAQEVYAFLADLRNYEQLMPSRVSEFHADEEEAHLKIDGMGKVRMKKGSCEENRRIVLEPEGSIPFTFTVHWELSDDGASTALLAYVDADLNMMMKMLAQGPLKEFINTQAHRLREVMESA